MATRNFSLNTEPHSAVIGDKTFLFQPEVTGAEFADVYNELREVQKKIKDAGGGKASSTKHAKEADVSSDTLKELSAAMYGFAVAFMLPESRDEFAKMRVPDRVLVQLMEWITELYGGGSGNPDADGGTSSD